MEYLDIVTEDGIPTGETMTREVAHAEGIRHRTAHVWVVRKKENGYDVLLQKRAMEKESFPGFYDTSSAGHIPAYNNPLDSALRELQEELGIIASKEDLQYAGMFHIRYEKEFHGKMFKDNEVTRVYVYSKPVNETELVLQASEVDEVKWFDLDEVWEEIQTDRHRFCMPMDGMKVLRDYLKRRMTLTLEIIACNRSVTVRIWDRDSDLRYSIDDIDYPDKSVKEKVSPVSAEEFICRLDEVRVSRWKKYYKPQDEFVLDGVDWTVKYEDSEHKLTVVKGYNAYPTSWKKFFKLLKDTVGDFTTCEN